MTVDHVEIVAIDRVYDNRIWYALRLWTTRDGKHCYFDVASNTLDMLHFMGTPSRFSQLSKQFGTCIEAVRYACNHRTIPLTPEIEQAAHDIDRMYEAQRDGIPDYYSPFLYTGESVPA